ncbi:hypothetical protein Sjap_024945 [Stephania japonica]|uniref:Protein kinase domain-containing protein n=1 Tax=Stephania japonica TaxID=461633 RepID=A0AAP0HKC0_9MAGN
MDLGTIDRMKYTDLLKEGFLLNWNLNSSSSCDKCRESGGRCGHIEEQFMCFCRDHNHTISCDVHDCTTTTTTHVVLNPRVQFLNSDRWYHIESLNYSGNEIVIHDQYLQEQLDSNTCNSLDNITIPESSALKFTTPIAPFYRCKCNESKSFDDHSSEFTAPIYNYSGCDDSYDLYFSKDPAAGESLPSLPETLIDLCSTFWLPRIPGWDPTKKGLASLFTACFYLRWEILPVCQNCRNKLGGQCTDNNGIGTGVGGIILGCIAFFIWQRRKKVRSISSTLLSRNISPEPSSKPDVEKGDSMLFTSIFTYDELVEATENFDESKELGDGGFGTVYHGKLRDGRDIAVKRLYEHNYKRVEQFVNEIKILSGLRHKYLVSLYGCTSRDSRELLLVYEFVSNGTVADHLHGNHAKAGHLTWPVRMSIAIESADALTYLHATEIIHRDVKTNNILLDNDFHVKVADFGLSRLFPTGVTHVSTAPQGTPGYVDPEYYQCYQLNDRSDVYSFGVVLIELISSKPAVDINRHRHEINLASMAINKILNHALHELVDPSLGYDSDYDVRRMVTSVAALAFRCLQQEKEMRPTMKEVLESLKSIEDEKYKRVKGEELDVTPEKGLLKAIPPLSPDSVTDKWASINTTPNTSA